MKTTINYYEKLMNLKEKLNKTGKELILNENDYFVVWYIKWYKKIKWVKNLYDYITYKETKMIQKKGDYYKDLYFYLS